jgi:hypothetical protein
MDSDRESHKSFQTGEVREPEAEHRRRATLYGDLAAIPTKGLWS